MEENKFMYNGESPGFSHQTQGGVIANDNGIFTGHDDNILARWWNPQIAEKAEFDKENYFMDKGNAFNEYMYNKANEWNSESAKMERAKEAGLNPMLMAAGIAGAGTSATPMQSQSANVGMNTSTESPFSMMQGAANTIDTLSGATDKLGKLIGFGKENKLNFDIAKKTATKLAEETGKTRWERLQIQRTFKAFCRTAEANAGAAEQNVKNLEKLFDKYQAEIDLLGEQKELTEEQVKTQEQVTKQELYKKYEMEFKKEFREMFGVQLNDSDLSMLTQLILGGHGRELINAFSEMITSIGEGIRDQLPEKPNLLEDSSKTTANIIRSTANKVREIVSNIKTKNKHKNVEDAIKYQWENNAYIRQQYKGYLEFRNEVLKEVHGGYSGKW